MHIHFSLVRIFLQSDCVPWLLVFFFCAGNNLFYFLPVFFPMVELLFLCFFLLNTYGFLLWDKYYQPAQVPDSTRVNPYNAMRTCIFLPIIHLLLLLINSMDYP